MVEFPMKHLINFGLLFFLLFTSHIRAAPILTGDVSFDDFTDLYTYTYTLDTSLLLDQTVEVGILQNLGFHFSQPNPVSHTEPDGWNFAISVGGLRNSGDQNILGSFWFWVNTSFSNDNMPSDQLMFSFTTERGVNTTLDNNYFIFNAGATTGPAENPGFIEIGHIVGPEFVTINEVSPVPENETYALMLAGLGMLGFVARHTKRRTKI
jgi:hypothetical protein